MFGLWCKGLHCAGCGKGIPLSVVVVLLLAATRVGSAVGHALAEAFVIVGVSVAFAAIATPLVLLAIMRRQPVLGGRWDGPTATETKVQTEMTDWSARAIIEGNPFLRESGEEIRSEVQAP